MSARGPRRPPRGENRCSTTGVRDRESPHFPLHRRQQASGGKATGVFKAAKVLEIASGGVALLLFVGLAGCGGKSASGNDGGGDDPKCPPQTSPALTCSPGVSPANPVITNFSAGEGWCASSGKWGTKGNLVGGLFSYKGTMTGTKASYSVVDGVFHLMGDVMPADYAGGGLAFDACVNTTTYTGVQFVLGGNAQGCNMQLQIQTYSQQASENRGGCVQDAGACYGFPRFFLPGEGGTIKVLWADVQGSGMPDAPAQIAGEVVGLQIQLQADSGAPCTGFDVTLDDVRFVQ